MTAPTEDPVKSPVEPDDPGSGVYLDLPEVSPSHRHGHRRLWRWGFPVALLLLFLAIPLLVYVGFRVVLDSHDGRIIVSTTDPTEPGWEAAVEPTPTAAIATISDTGDLTSVNVLALTSDGVGSVVFVPGDTRAPNQTGAQTLVTAYKTGGVDAVKAALESILGAEVGEVEVADAARWEELVGPAGSLTVANPDDVVFGGKTLFAKGSIDVTPAQVGVYLRMRNWSENDTNRLLRQEAFWQAWLAKVAAANNPNIVPGETDSGVGRFVRSLADDQVDYEVLPVKVEALTDAFAGVYVPLTDDVKALVARIIPFPAAAPPGSRPRVRVLDGTGQLDHGGGAAQVLTAAGAEIDAVGNASSFKVPTTQFIVAGPDHQAEAEKLLAALGVGEIVQSNDTSDSVDITVILGADALSAPSLDGASSSTTSSASPTTAGG